MSEIKYQITRRVVLADEKRTKKEFVEELSLTEARIKCLMYNLKVDNGVFNSSTRERKWGIPPYNKKAFAALPPDVGQVLNYEIAIRRVVT